MVKYGKALRTLWNGTCTAYGLVNRVNPVNKRTDQAEVVLFEDAPCRLSFSSIAITGSADHAATAGQAVKLFIAPELDIPPGSKLMVTQNGTTGAYAHSGVPAVYEGHQEIMVEPFEGWA